MHHRWTDIIDSAIKTVLHLVSSNEGGFWWTTHEDFVSVYIRIGVAGGRGGGGGRGDGGGGCGGHGTGPRPCQETFAD